MRSPIACRVELPQAGERESFAAGDVLYEHAVREAPFFVIERGLVEFVDRKPGKDVHIAQAGRSRATLRLTKRSNGRKGYRGSITLGVAT